MDKHLNVFYAYRQGNPEDVEGERILEDNVTRSLIIALGSSGLLTEQFLEAFTGIRTQSPYTYTLQSRLKTEPPDSSKSLQFPGKCVIVIAARPKTPNSLQVSDTVMQKIGVLIERGSSRLRSTLSRLSSLAEEESLSQGVVQKELKQLLDLNDSTADGTDFGDSDLIAFLYELTFGSRPDALITSGRVTALFENKLRGSVTDVQIQRHIRENFGGGLEPRYLLGRLGEASRNQNPVNQVPVVLWSWRDVHTFFSRFRADETCSADPKLSFIVDQFLEYLEVLGMGDIKFTQDDFLTTWEPYNDHDGITLLRERVKALGDALADELQDLQDHRVKVQKRSRHYLGINVWHKFGTSTQPDQVPHLSCALQQHGSETRCLRLFVQCESKPLVERLLKQRTRLECEISDALWVAHSLPGLVLRVEEKFFIAPGGAGKAEGLWDSYFSYPLEMCSDQAALHAVVHQAFDALAYLHDPKLRKERLAAAGRGRGVWGILQLNYRWNWFVLEKEGGAIVQQVVSVAKKLRPYYKVLLEANERGSATPTRRRPNTPA
jgi:hypothetical protein